MDSKKMAKQTFELYKLTFENALNSMILFQEQNKKMIDIYLEQMTDLPGEDKKIIQDWSKTVNAGVADFKACIDEGFKKAEEYFSRSAQGSNPEGRSRKSEGK